MILLVQGLTCVVLESAFSYGEMVVYVPDGAIIPDYLKHLCLDRLDADGRVVPRLIAGNLSHGVLLPTTDRDYWEDDCLVIDEKGEKKYAQVGDDVAGILGITFAAD